MYIEREKVVELITRRYECPEICIAEINSIPAADVVEVVRGCWENEGTCGNYDKMRCTACTCLLLVNWFDRSMVYRYCPNCGARMDGGKHG